MPTKNNVVNLRRYTTDATGYVDSIETDQSEAIPQEWLVEKITDLEDRMQEMEQRASDQASPENIYEIIGEEPTQSIDSIIIKCREILSEAQVHLRRGLEHFAEEILKESEMDLFYGSIRRLLGIRTLSENFRDAVTALVVSLESHVSKPYTREEIVLFNKVILRLADNIRLSEDVLDECIELLEQKFDLSAPFTGIELNDLS